jgi:tRNA U34 5-carboxymethylaminomethyl modifying GTPase MnmE/TrmE
MVSSDIERALRAVSETDGREVSEAVTNDIFAKFCVGK